MNNYYGCSYDPGWIGWNWVEIEGVDLGSGQKYRLISSQYIIWRSNSYRLSQSSMAINNKPDIAINSKLRSKLSGL